MMRRWREWLRWSWFGEAVKFVSSELRFSRSGAQGLLLNYRDLWPQEYSERPFTLAVWLCSFVERHKVSGSWMQSAVSSLSNRQYQAVQGAQFFIKLQARYMHLVEKGHGATYPTFIASPAEPPKPCEQFQIETRPDIERAFRIKHPLQSLPQHARRRHRHAVARDDQTGVAV